MMISFFDKPKKNIVNIFYDKKQKLSEKLIGKKIKFLKLNNKFDVNSSLIFSFCNLFDLKKFFKTKLIKKDHEKNIYLIFNADKSNLSNKLAVFIFLLLKKKKNFIMFYKGNANSFVPDFLYQVKIHSFYKSIIYFIFQYMKNIFIIFKSKKILTKL